MAYSMIACEVAFGNQSFDFGDCFVQRSRQYDFRSSTRLTSGRVAG
jgi:hypothetical protein